MFKMWIKKSKEKLIIPTTANNTGLNITLTAFRSVIGNTRGEVRKVLKTSDGFIASQKNIASNVMPANIELSGLPATARIYEITLAGNLSFKNIKKFYMSGVQYTYPLNTSMFTVFSRLQELTVIINNDANLENQSGWLSSDNFADLKCPLLFFKIWDHSRGTTGRGKIIFDKPNQLSKLVELYIGAVYNRFALGGELRYLPRTLRTISDDEYTISSGFTGKLSDFPDMITVSLMCLNGNNIIGYDSRIWRQPLNAFKCKNVTLTSAELDQFLIDISANSWTGTKILIITQRVSNGIGIRTSASDDAVAILKSKGVSITISNNTF